MVYCPGHAGVNGNDRADRLAGKATITGGLRLGKISVEELETLPAGTKPSIARRRESRGERRRRSSLRGQERVIVNQTNVATVSRATLGKLLRDGVERIWAFPSA